MLTAQEVLNQAGVSAEILDTFNLGDRHNLHVLRIKPDDCLTIVKKFLVVARQTGYCPILAYNGEVDYHLDILEDNYNMPVPGKKPEETAIDVSLAAAAAFNYDEWLKSVEVDEMPDGDFSKEKDPWCEVAPSDMLFLVPVSESWQAPAVLYFGGWNNCPEYDVHMAMLKRWHDKYGAELVCMGPDALYCMVARPVTDREEAMALAREQAVYCPNNVLQGYGDGTISGLAIDLQNSTAWQFWWD